MSRNRLHDGAEARAFDVGSVHQWFFPGPAIPQVDDLTFDVKAPFPGQAPNTHGPSIADNVLDGIGERLGGTSYVGRDVVSWQRPRWKQVALTLIR